MGWKAETGREQEWLNGIIARLLSLAELAERAAERSPWVRWLALWSLWRAHAVVTDFIAGSTLNPAGRHWSPAMMPRRYGTDPADAIDLAVSLRALALIVRDMAAQIRRLSFLQLDQTSGRNHDGGPTHGLDKIILRLRTATLSPAELCDTS